jgi:hypothetical protein
MPYLFLSYAIADRDTAFVMRDVLRNEGFLVWMNENADEPYNHQWKEIEANIANAGAFVLLMSDEAKKSKWLRRELTFARESERLILPILIQGEAWEGFAQQAIPLNVGLRLDIPDERIAEIKNQLKNYPDSALPNPLPDASVEARQQRNVLITSALIVLFIIVVFRLALYFRNMDIETAERATNAVFTQEMLQITESYSQQVATETAEAELAIHATASHVALWNILAPNSNINREANLTRQARNLEANARMADSATRQANMQLTAVGGNGFLPCTATIHAVEGSEGIEIYVEPSLDSIFFIRDVIIFSGYSVAVNEWIVNEDGAWYRIATEGSRVNYGYVLGENLQLDEDCPR